MACTAVAGRQVDHRRVLDDARRCAAAHGFSFGLPRSLSSIVVHGVSSLSPSGSVPTPGVARSARVRSRSRGALAAGRTGEAGDRALAGDQPLHRGAMSVPAAVSPSAG
jgi:hypothetical protein